MTLSQRIIGYLFWPAALATVVLYVLFARSCFATSLRPSKVQLALCHTGSVTRSLGAPGYPRPDNAPKQYIPDTCQLSCLWCHHPGKKETVAWALARL